MSALVGQTAGTFGGIVIGPDYTDRNCLDSSYRWGHGAAAAERPWQDGALWPMSRFAGMAGDMSNQVNGTYGGAWGTIAQDFAGGQQAKKLIGTTLDSAGAPLGSCVVEAFTTADDVKQGSVTSDTAGYYALCTFKTTAHYIVAYKAGAPDVAGTTLNTLIPV